MLPRAKTHPSIVLGCTSLGRGTTERSWLGQSVCGSARLNAIQEGGPHVRAMAPHDGEPHAPLAELKHVYAEQDEARKRAAKAGHRHQHYVESHPEKFEENHTGSRAFERVLEEQNQARRAASAKGRKQHSLQQPAPATEPSKTAPLSGEALTTLGMTGKMAALEHERRELLKAEQERKRNRQKKKKAKVTMEETGAAQPHRHRAAQGAGADDEAAGQPAPRMRRPSLLRGNTTGWGIWFNMGGTDSSTSGEAGTSDEGFISSKMFRLSTYATAFSGGNSRNSKAADASVQFEPERDNDTRDKPKISKSRVRRLSHALINAAQLAQAKSGRASPTPTRDVHLSAANVPRPVEQGLSR